MAMTKALAKEVGGAGILVNTVAPGFTMSDGVLANPVQVAEAAGDLGAGPRHPARPVPVRHRRRRRVLLQPTSPRSSPARRCWSTAGRTSIDAVLQLQRPPRAGRRRARARGGRARSSTSPRVRRASASSRSPRTRRRTLTRARVGAGPGARCSSGRSSPTAAPDAVLAADGRRCRASRTCCAATASTSRPAAWRSCTRTRGRASAASSTALSRVETAGRRARDRPLGRLVRGRPGPGLRRGARRRAGGLRARHGAAAAAARAAVDPLRPGRGPRPAEEPALHRLRRRAAGVSAQRRTAPRRPAGRARRRPGVRRPRRELPRPARRACTRTATASASSPRGTRAARPTWPRPTAS